MAAKAQRYVSPITGDYVVEAGGLKEDESFITKVVLALRTKRGTMIAFPEFGSRLHEIRKADERGRKLAEKHATQALAHLVDQITDLTIQAVLDAATPNAIVIIVSGRVGSRVVTARYSAAVGT